MKSATKKPTITKLSQAKLADNYCKQVAARFDDPNIDAEPEHLNGLAMLNTNLRNILNKAQVEPSEGGEADGSLNHAHWLACREVDRCLRDLGYAVERWRMTYDKPR